jgi:hypothetical protein
MKLGNASIFLGGALFALGIDMIGEKPLEDLAEMIFHLGSTSHEGRVLACRGLAQNYSRLSARFFDSEWAIDSNGETPGAAVYSVTILGHKRLTTGRRHLQSETF